MSDLELIRKVRRGVFKVTGSYDPVDEFFVSNKPIIDALKENNNCIEKTIRHFLLLKDIIIDDKQFHESKSWMERGYKTWCCHQHVQEYIDKKNKSKKLSKSDNLKDKD